MKNIFSFLLVGLCLATPLFGGISERLADYIARNLKGIVIDQNIVDQSDKNILIQNSSGEMISVHLGKKLGAGWFGSVYDLSAEEAKRLNIDWQGPLIAKVGHIFRRLPFNIPYPRSRASLRRELVNYNAIVPNISKIESDSMLRFGPDLHWEQGSAPIAPIIGLFESEIGPILIKPKISGIELSDLKERLKTDMLPREVEQSFSNIYYFAQAVRRHVKIEKGLFHFTKYQVGYSPDIRPSNGVWVSDPLLLEQLKMKRPGILFFEFDRVPGNYPQYIHPQTSCEDYLQEVRKYYHGE